LKTSCGFARERGAPTPSSAPSNEPFDTRPGIETFGHLRQSLRGTRIGDGGPEVCRALTSSLDSVIGELASQIEGPADFAVVALGGYGRKELSLFSDVDVMVLHDVPDPSEIAASIFRPLWDANLRLGHSVRTVGEAADAARERYDTQTSLLTSRVIAGNEDLLDQLRKRLASVARARPLKPFLLSEERERRADNPYLLMAADIKTGRGGLRSLQVFEWERRRSELVGAGPVDPSEGEGAARDALLAIRNGLHSITGRSYDTFSPELREAVGRWLGRDSFDAGAILAGALQTTDRIVTEHWPELLEPHDPVAKLGLRLGKKLRKRVRRVEAPGSGQSLRADAKPTPDEFVAILRSGERGRHAMSQLADSGVFTDMLPEWTIVSAAPQLAPFHEHAVDVHLWRTVDEMISLIEGDDSYFRDIAAEFGNEGALLLAAFLHDIGKGQGGDHANAGAAIARVFCDRLGVSDATTDVVESAVRHHLLLAETATRRDIDDPAVISEVVATVGDLRNLQVLYLLTVADSKATGATMWSDWKATLVRTVFLRCAARFGADRLVEEPGGTTREAILAASGNDRRDQVESHIDLMPPDYLRSTTADEVIWHIDLIDQLKGNAHVAVRSGEAADTAVVIGRKLPGFRGAAAGSLAANGIDVLEARMLGRGDGLIVDSFRVRDDRTGGPVPPVRWDRVRQDLEAALAGDLDTASKVATRAAAYATEAPAGVSVRVNAGVDPASQDTVITIHCSDRIGRLAEILGALYKSGLEIRLAKLDSRGGEVVDTFLVRKEGTPIHDSVVLRGLEEEIAQWIEP